MEEQRSGLNSVFDEWKGNHEQIDDVWLWAWEFEKKIELE